MKWKLLILAVFMVGFLIGSCAVQTGNGDAMRTIAIDPIETQKQSKQITLQTNWSPEIGKIYERDGSKPRQVIETWEHGVRWKHPGENRSYECLPQTWIRWLRRTGK